MSAGTVRQWLPRYPFQVYPVPFGHLGRAVLHSQRLHCLQRHMRRRPWQLLRDRRNVRWWHSLSPGVVRGDTWTDDVGVQWAVHRGAWVRVWLRLHVSRWDAM